MSMHRIAPLEPPYSPDVEEALARWIPPGMPVPPLGLFRVLARHPALAERLRSLGAILLARGTLPPRVRELLVLRTSFRCHAEYEWGVHVAAYAERAGLDAAAVEATVCLSPDAVARRSDADGLLLRAADELHDHGALSDAVFAPLQGELGDAGMIELASVCGFYHLVAFVLGTARLEPEPWARRYPENAALAAASG